MVPFEHLKAWKAAHKLALAVYRSTDSFPTTERYGLTSQLRRAAYSVAANIAEGSAKRGNRELRRFLDIALGSLSEIAYGLILARDLGLLGCDEWQSIDKQRDDAGRILWGLYRKLG